MSRFQNLPSSLRPSQSLGSCTKWHHLEDASVALGSSHPSWWSKDFHFEAEAHHVEPMANPTPPKPIVANAPTVHTRRRMKETHGLYDFVGSSSYIRLVGDAVAEFRFQPRSPNGLHVVQYKVEAAGRGSGCVKIDVTPTGDLAHQPQPQPHPQSQLLCFTPAATVARGGHISVRTGVDHSIQMRAADSSRNMDVDWVRVLRVGV